MTNMIIPRQHLKKYHVCERCLARYRGGGRLLMLYLVADSKSMIFHIVPTLLYFPYPTRVRAYAANTALCGWAVPAAWRGRFLTAHKALAHEPVVRFVLSSNIILLNRPLTLSLLNHYKIEIKEEITLAQLAEMDDATC